MTCGFATSRVPGNAPIESSDPEYFTVTHCFHPLYQRRFRLVEYSRNWGAERVSFFDDERALSYLPARWTDRFPPEAFAFFSKGKAYFSVDGLIELSTFIKGMERERKEAVRVT